MKFTQSFQIGQLQLKNRFIMAPVKTAYGTPQGNVTKRHLTYYDNLSKGGAALIILEPVAVNQSGKEHPKQICVHLPNSRENLAKIVDVLHRNGTLACLNINHAGRAANPKATGMPPQAPSPVTCPATGLTPETLQKTEIEGILEGYRQALRVARAAGFDAVEIQAGHGYLVQQFLSARTNHREDEYGKDRSLFLSKLFSLVAEEKKNLAVFVRISADDFVADSTARQDNKAILNMAEKYGFDAVHCGLGNACDSPAWYYSHMALPEENQIKAVRLIRRQTSLPLIVAGRMGNPEKLEQYDREGLADCVALGRPLVADPQFVNKLLQEQNDEITYCGYCLQGCLVNVKNGKGLGCIVNPRVDKTPLTASEPKKVAVLGGGPAGMAAATQLSLMGHNVTLFEKQAELGGQFALAHKAPHKDAMLRPLQSLVKQTMKQVADIRLASPVSVPPVDQFEHFIVATGSKQRIPDIPGLEQQYAMTSLEFFGLSKPVKGSRVLIIGAGMVGVEAAEILADQDYEIVITKRSSEIANDMELITKKLLLKRLEQKTNLTISANTTITAFTADGVQYMRNGIPGSWPAFDTVIIAAGMEPENRLYQQLKASGKPVEIAGDAALPEDIYAATQNGYLAAVQLG